jgi:hypothetical protein
MATQSRARSRDEVRGSPTMRRESEAGALSVADARWDNAESQRSREEQWLPRRAASTR